MGKVDSKTPLITDDKAQSVYAYTGGSEGWGQPPASHYNLVIKDGVMFGYVTSTMATSSSGSTNPAVGTESVFLPQKNDQFWYWSETWQAMEQEADRDLVEGNYETFDDPDDFIASL